MLIYFQEIVLTIIIWILRMIQGLIEICNSVLGIDTLMYNNEKMNMLEYIINDSRITNIFWIIFIITIFLCSIFAIVSIIKNAITTHDFLTNIIGKYILSIISIMIVLILIFIIVIITNIFMDLILSLFNIDVDINISKKIFDYCVNNWFNDYSINEINIFTVSTKQLLGDYKQESYLVIPSEWLYNGMINPDDFAYLPALICGSIVLLSFIYSVIIIFKRIYEIIFLYIIMPITMAIISIDNGARFKIWIEEFITKIITIFIVILSVQLFLIITPILLKIKLLNNISLYGQSLFKLCLISGGALFNITAIKIVNKIINNKNIKNTILINKKVILQRYISEAQNENYS